MESLNIIICPHCNEKIIPSDYLKPGEFEGNFKVECTECGKNFSVMFQVDIKFVSYE